MTDNIEILSPSGDMECFIAAVNNGADAIYIGGSAFSARKSAKNFTNEELESAVDYAHLRNVKVYVAVNILINEDELQSVFDFIKFCCNVGVDALIIQDLGVAYIAKKYFPDIPIHASTQMTIHNLAGVNIAKKLGFKRVVLSRELSFNEIEFINSNTDLETEIFAHGALCMSYSGQCLFSSMLGGRSGNRGACAQPCRLPYTVLDKQYNQIGKSDKYYLSLKDLCLADDIKKLASCGVASLKIEGRMKNREYVAIVTSMYDKYRDGAIVTREDMSVLENIFSRNGFTKGYLNNSTGAHMLNIDRNNDNIYKDIQKDVLDIADILLSKKKTMGIKCLIKVQAGKEAVLTLSSGKYEATVCSDEVVSVAQKVATDRERIISQISKLGTTPFHIDEIECISDDDINIPISTLNDMRRKCADELCNMITSGYKKNYNPDFNNYIKKDILSGVKHYCASVRTYEQAIAAYKAGFSKIYINIDIYKNNKSFFDENNDVFAIMLPNVMRDIKMEDYSMCSLENFCISNISQAELFKDKILHANFTMNICNSMAVLALESLGIKSFCASVELTVDRIRQISGITPMEVLVYGRIPLMTVRNCIYKSSSGKCGFSDDCFYLRDRKNALFPVVANCNMCTNTLYNSVPVYMGDKMSELEKTNATWYRFDFTFETEEEIFEIVSMYDNKQKYNKGDFTRGHFFRGV